MKKSCAWSNGLYLGGEHNAKEKRGLTLQEELGHQRTWSALFYGSFQNMMAENINRGDLHLGPAINKALNPALQIKVTLTKERWPFVSE